MNKNRILIIIISMLFIFAFYGQSVFGANTATITGSFQPQSGNVVLSHENPENGSSDVSPSITIWNITIEDPNGDHFNWSIKVVNKSTGYVINTNSSNVTTNGSKEVNITDRLVVSTNYTVYVNTTDNSTWTNESFWFVTWDSANFTVYETLSFGGYVDAQESNASLSPTPANQSTSQNMYVMLYLTVTDPQGDNLNVSWSTNATGTWVYYNSTVASGSTVQQRATFANASATKYWWNVSVNDTDNHWTNETYWFTTATYSWTNWSTWWTFNFTCCVASDFTATKYNRTDINLTWNNCVSEGCDSNVVVRNASGWGAATYPITPTNGTEIYNGTLEKFNDTGLKSGTTYYYTIWGWNNSENEYSIVNYTDSATTQGDIEIYTASVYPANGSTEVERPATNWSIIVNGTDIAVYFYFTNYTETSNKTSLVTNWSGESTQRFVFDTFGWSPRTDFMWGNTKYNWSVNVTDGVTWVNETFIFTSISTYGSSSARYDVQIPLATINAGDAQAAWAKRDGAGYSYNRIYDVQVPHGTINAGDAQLIWSQRT